MTFILLKRESKYSESKLLPCFLIYQWYFGMLVFLFYYSFLFSPLYYIVFHNPFFNQSHLRGFRHETFNSISENAE